jgi:addiction module RelE/StbE family toxin
MVLEWSVFALADRDSIFDHIEADSPQAAVSVDDRIQACVENLNRFPEMGRPGRIEGTRELVISGTPYIAGYRIADDTVRVLRLLHGAQQWPDDVPGYPE